MKLAAMRTYKVQMVYFCNICTKLPQWTGVLLGKLINAMPTKKFLAFVEPKGSLPCLQEPTTGYGAEIAESSPYSVTIFLKINFIIILLSVPRFPRWYLSLFFSD
jgi:hypothetical protein